MLLTQIRIRRHHWLNRDYFQVVLVQPGKKPIALLDWSRQRRPIYQQANDIHSFLRVSPTAQEIM